MRRTFSLITLFPELVDAFAAIGLARKARAAGLLEIEAISPRDFATDARRTVDDVPYGGGPGMVMQVAPLRRAIASTRERLPGARVIYLSPQGRTLKQEFLPELLAPPHLILVAGRYEGIDERLITHDIDEEWSIGDYVLSGGELPAMVLMDALVRLIPGVMGDPASAEAESFTRGLLDFPHYTRPENIEGQAVPPVLLSGDHAKIAEWRLRAALSRTALRRPDLLARALDHPDISKLWAEISAEEWEEPPKKA